ncbi:MAG: hydrogen peroxide-inducible genes activator, partial [Rhodospirillales bacterium]|nr:hydrogen peroxide-inducible genes activator [Rhodospirillales bacterium]
VLFERTNRSVRVTPIGEEIVAQARRLVNLSEEIIAKARSARDPLSGPFRLGMISTVCPYLSPLVLPAIRREMPNLSLTLIEGLTADLESRVVSGELDGAILATPPQDSHLTDIPLYAEPFRIALYNKHHLANQKTIDLEELAHEELLLLADGHCLRDQVMDACHASAETGKINTRETSLETLLAFVAAEEGVTLVPVLSVAAWDGKRGMITLRPEATGTAERTVRLVCRASFPRPEAVARLGSTIRGNVPKAAVRILA